MKKLFILIFAGILSFLIILTLWAIHVAVFLSLIYPAISALVFMVIWYFFMKFFYNLLDWGTHYKKPLIICLIVSVLFGIYTYIEFVKLNEISKIEVMKNDIDLYKFTPFLDGKINNNLAVVKSDFKISNNLPVLDGATALYPVYAAFAQAVYPQKMDDLWLDYEYFSDKSKVKCSKTKKAYENLIDKKVDIIFVAGASDEQLKLAKDKNVTLKFTPIGKEAFVFFVNANNELRSISVDEIVKIYSGKIVNFKEIGGKNEKILAFQRDKNSGSQTALENIMQGKNLIKPLETEIIDSMGGIIKSAGDYKNYKNALGFSFLYFVKNMVKDNKIKLLNINGIEPNRSNIANNSYPFVDEFYAVTLEENKSEEVSKFISWILSESGKEIIEKTGYASL